MIIHCENESLKLYTAASADVKNWTRFQRFNSLYGRIGVFIIHRYITFINKSQSTQSSCVAFKWMEFPFSRRDKKIVCLANIIQTPEIVESEFFKFIRILYILPTFWNLLLLWSGVNFFYIKICSGAEMSVCL